MSEQQPQAATVQHYRPLTELIPVHWQSGNIQAADGTRLHYTRTGGTKPTLLLLHGVQVSGLSWLRTAQALEADYDLILPDFRGHGQSGRLTNGVSAEMLVNDTRALIQGLGLERPFVMGHSMGADIAGRLAAVADLRGVVLVDPALQSFPAALLTADNTPPWMQAILDTLQALKTQSHAERMVSGLQLMPPGGAISNETDYVAFVEGEAQFDLNFFHHIANMGYLFQDTAVIAQITCPLLLLTARSMMPGAQTEAGLAAFKTHWQAGQHIHFEDSGHAIMFDQFERFVAVVRQFLEAH